VVKDGIYRNCYAVGWTAGFKKGRVTLFGLTRNPVRYVQKITTDVTTYSYAIQTTFGPRVHNFPHTDFCVITKCCIIHDRVAVFCIAVIEYDEFWTQILIKHELSPLVSLFSTAQEWTVPYVGIVLSLIYLFTLQNCGLRKSVHCKMEDARFQK
jgi:hypothetical protein